MSKTTPTFFSYHVPSTDPARPPHFANIVFDAPVPMSPGDFEKIEKAIWDIRGTARVPTIISFQRLNA